MAESVLIMTAIVAEAGALKTVGLDATVIGIRGGRLDKLEVPAGTRWIVLAGVGGGLDPTLAIGDVVVDGPVEVVPAKARRGTVYTADRIVSTVEQKSALFARTGAAVVDMEQSIVRAWATTRGLPLIGVRAVSDTAADLIDPAVLGFVDLNGHVKPLSIASTLIRRPRLVGPLMRLGRSTKIALAQLGPVVREIVENLG